MENTGINQEKKKRGRPAIYSAEQIKEKRRAYEREYKRNKYHSDPEYKSKKNEDRLNRYYSDKKEMLL